MMSQSDVQLLNASFSISSSPFPRRTVVGCVQKANALFLITLTA